MAESLSERKTAYGLADELGERLNTAGAGVEMRGGRKVVASKRFFAGRILSERQVTGTTRQQVRRPPTAPELLGPGAHPHPPRT